MGLRLFRIYEREDYMQQYTYSEYHLVYFETRPLPASPGHCD